MNKQIKILHIYNGSQASGGLYLKEIEDGIEKLGNFKQRTIVSYYYPFKSRYKIFYRHTDLASKMKKNRLRLYIRYIELIFGLIHSTLIIKNYNPQIINYSLNTGFKPELLFLRLIKFSSSAKIFITCHDVIPFTGSKKVNDTALAKRKSFYELADFLLVHNQQSALELEKIFKQDRKKIKYHPFPIMDLNKLKIDKNEFTIKGEYDFCFLGHLRFEKGINLLLKVWKRFNEKYPDAKLIIGGNLAMDIKLDITDLNKSNITLVLKYLTDKEYLNITSISKAIVMPYIRSTNSGVLSTILPTNLEIIASDIPLFKNHTLIDDKYIFKANDENDLMKKLELSYLNKENKESPISRIKLYRENFYKHLSLAYNYNDFDISTYEALGLKRPVIWSDEMDTDEYLANCLAVITVNPTVENVANAMKETLELDTSKIDWTGLNEYTWVTYFQKILEKTV